MIFNLQISKVLAVVSLCLWTVNAFAYDVWMGTSCTPKNAAVDPSTWRNTAALVQGLNINLADCKPDPGTPTVSETACGIADWRTIFNQIQHDDNGFVPVPRSNFGPVGPNADTTLERLVDHMFNSAASFGYGIRNVMIYGNAIGTASYNWTDADVQHLRDCLDAKGLTNVGILYDIRNINGFSKIANPLITGIVMEADFTRWYNDSGGRQELL